MTIFVDVDDTLVLYKDQLTVHPYGVLHGQPYEPNCKLIDKLKPYSGRIVVWSGGGSQYAKDVARKVLPKDLKFIVASKFSDFNQIKPGDTVIDDQKEYYTSMREFGVKVYGPLEDWR